MLDNALDDGPDAEVGLGGCAGFEGDGECEWVERSRGGGRGKRGMRGGREEAFGGVVDA